MYVWKVGSYDVIETWSTSAQLPMQFTLRVVNFWPHALITPKIAEVTQVKLEDVFLVYESHLNLVME